MSAGHRAGSQLMETLSLATIRGHPSLNQHADPLWNAGYICWATHFSSSEAPWGVFFFFFQPQITFYPVTWLPSIQECSETHTPHPPPSAHEPTLPTHHLLPMTTTQQPSALPF